MAEDTMQTANRGVALVVLAAALIFGASSPSYARSWICNATISLVGASNSYTVPSWNMSGGVLADRQKACMNKLKADWISNGKIYGKLNVTSAQQQTICAAHGFQVRAEYGFDKRAKEWNFIQWVPRC
jgi:hypothetical protein